MTIELLKAGAQRLATHLARVHGFTLKRAAALEALAALHGSSNWNALRASAETSSSGKSLIPSEVGGNSTSDSQAGGWGYVQERISAALEVDGPISFPEDARMHTRQLQRVVDSFPTMSEFWRRHALPSKLAPRCMCCNKSMYDAATAFRHPDLPNVTVCVECCPRQPVKIESPLQAWIVDDGEWVVGRSEAEVRDWLDKQFGPCEWEEGRTLEAISLDKPVHVEDSVSSPMVPFRELVNQHIRAGGSFPAALACELDCL